MTRCTHSAHGLGTIEDRSGATARVRFDLRPHEALALPVAELALDPPLSPGLAGLSPDPGAALRAVATAIRSAHERSGLFAPAPIRLYPHQLWVAERVLSRWPARCLIGDDVGLGKTIEAGLVLSALLAAGLVKRLLVLCPAGLVDQWQERLYDLFDIRAQICDGQVERQKGFWDHPRQQVVASFHRLRLDRPVGEATRWEALAAAPAWDLVIVDEAHHLNADPVQGPTLGLQLLHMLDKAGKIGGLLLFTGTPHRGKTYGFQSLLGLVDPEVRGDTPWQRVRERLPFVMIRNNKRHCIDVEGQPLFQPVTVTTRPFQSTEPERALYRRFSALVREGLVFGGSGGGGGGRPGSSWLLYALQKIATSSVAALVAALSTRRRGLKRAADHAAAVAELAAERAWEVGSPDREAELIAALPGAGASPDAEIRHIDELLGLAKSVSLESRLREVLEIARTLPERETLLLFTEYKATQALVVSGLAAAFGPQTVAFINGDGRLDNVAHGVGPYLTLEADRASTAYKFNRGTVRFLVSTESAAEGIDLHESCWRLVHIDMPWNPMRMHQRVGRLDRIGQTRPIQVTILRNLDSLEETILSVFYKRIEQVQKAHSAAMDRPDDILEMVLGALPNPATLLGGVTQQAHQQGWGEARVEAWACDLIPVGIQAELGHAAEVVRQAAQYSPDASRLRSVPLPLTALVPFVLSAARAAGSTDCVVDDGRVTLTTPLGWRDPAFTHFTLLRPARLTLQFDRTPPAFGSPPVLYGGPGNRLFDAALAWAERLPGRLALLPGLPRPLVVFACLPLHPPGRVAVRRVVVGAELGEGGVWTSLSDQDVVSRVNEAWAAGGENYRGPPFSLPEVEAAKGVVLREAGRHGVPWESVVAHPIAILLPSPVSASHFPPLPNPSAGAEVR